MHSDRLPSCNKWHPQAEPDFTTWAPSGRQRNPRRICRLCKRIRYGKNMPTRKEKPFIPLGKPYGVIPLKWTPPEFHWLEDPVLIAHNKMRQKMGLVAIYPAGKEI